MPGRSFKVARIAGIPVGISPWWLVIVALITWSLGAGYYPVEVKGIAPLASYGLGLASVLLLFASILAHEFGHALVARRRGVEIEEIDLWLLGGVSRMKGQPKTPGDELAFALAGPAVTAVIAAVFGAVWLLLPSSAPSWLHALIVYEAEVNGLILAFNLIPAFPLDGGRVARALLWRRSGDISRATESAAGLGRVFGYLMVVFGVLATFGGAFEGLWIALIGMFVVAAAKAELLQEEVTAAFGGVVARDLMSHPAISIASDATLDEAQAQFASYRYNAFPGHRSRRARDRCAEHRAARASTAVALVGVDRRRPRRSRSGAAGGRAGGRRPPARRAGVCPRRPCRRDRSRRPPGRRRLDHRRAALDSGEAPGRPDPPAGRPHGAHVTSHGGPAVFRASLGRLRGA